MLRDFELDTEFVLDDKIGNSLSVGGGGGGAFLKGFPCKVSGVVVGCGCESDASVN